MSDKILVPLDGSPLADRILRHVRRLLVREDAEVTLVGVVPSASLTSDHPPGQNPLTVLRRHIDARRDELREQGARAESRVLVGDPAGKILDFARENGTTLIALSTHGRTGLARMLRGSVAERILRHATVPVLAANPLALKPADEIRFKKIFVPLDGSDLSAKALPVAAELARLYDAELLLFHSIEVAVSTDPIVVTAPVMTEADARALLARHKAQVATLRTSEAIGYGPAAANIVDAAKHEGADLICMATHGRTGVSRWMLGSEAEQVLREAPVPLLLVRSTLPREPKRAVREEPAKTGA